MDHRPLNQDLNEIRLLTITPSEDVSRIWTDPIECRLEHVSGRQGVLPSGAPPQSQDNEAPVQGNNDADSCWGDFIALSYAWGDPNDTCVISVNGNPVFVTKNLEAALKQLRATDFNKLCYGKRSYPVWVDAICINQKDLDERNQQVQRMRSIYTKAKIVMAWLGPAAHESEKAMAFIQRMGERYRDDINMVSEPARTQPGDPEFLGDGIANAINYFFGRAYWNRLWVLQEVAVGDVVVMCGQQWAPWDFIVVTFVRLSLAWPHFVSIINYEVSQGRAIRRKYPLDGFLQMSICRQNVLQNGAVQNTMDIVAGVQLLQTTDPRDKVYGVLGLMNPSLRTAIEPNYALDVPDVYLTLARQTIYTENSLEILRLANSAKRLNLLPSWVPNLESSSEGYPIGRAYDNSVSFSCSGSFKPTVAFQDSGSLQVRGLILGTVGGLGAVHYSDRELYPDASFNVVNTQNMSIGHPYGDANSLREALWQTLLTGAITGNDAASVNWRTLTLAPEFSNFDNVHTTYDYHGDNAVFMSLFLSSNKDLAVFGMELLPLLCDSGESEPVAPNLLEKVLSVISIVGRDRRLIMTLNGYLGLGPVYTRPGDVVVILPGCSVPLILRRSGEEFTLVGDGYIHGFMHGEAVAGFGDSDHRWEPLTLK